MPNEVHVAGLDIAKSVFQVHGADRDGKALVRRKLRRDDVEAFFRGLPSCLVGIEACPSSHYWARRLRDLGHDVRLIPTQYVRPYVKTNKNDAADAEATSEAIVRPSMRFVPIKEEMQQEVLVIHRVREMLVGQRTQLINAIRGHLAEFGVIGPSRAHNIGLLTTMIEDETETRIPPVARHALRHLVEQLRAGKVKLVRIDEDLAKVAKSSDACRRLMTITGVGIITASALVASMRDPADFKSGRHFSAWLGLVPKQHQQAERSSWARSASVAMAICESCWFTAVARSCAGAGASGHGLRDCEIVDLPTLQSLRSRTRRRASYGRCCATAEPTGNRPAWQRDLRRHSNRPEEGLMRLRGQTGR